MNTIDHPGFAKRAARLAGAAAMAAALTACAAMPSQGPSAPSIAREGTSDAPPFLSVPVDRIVLTALATKSGDDLTPMATPEAPPQNTIRVGDTVSVTLWEFGSGLLGPLPVSQAQPGLAGAQSATVPNQTVDQSGTIIVPFAGEIRVVGRTPRQVQAAIIQALRGKANETQALVQVVQTTENAVTVTGDVAKPGRFPLAISGTRLLDAVAVAGGTTGKARDMLVQLTRGGQVRSLRMAAVLRDPAQNIFLRPGDLVTLDHEPQSVVVLGATNKQSEVFFGKARLTLAEAIGNGGGLADRQADPYGIYVLRYERTEVAAKLRTTPLPDYLTLGDSVPVVYHIDFRSAEGMLLAQNFQMHDQDLVYVATSPSVQVGKLAVLLNSVTSIFKRNSYNAFNY
ncbi:MULTISPECIES: polysaccharide biosynthesis/export family protein [unclassified Sphingomonas]|uniref:polysaccharide biosynthesis/export family protein n=1 Tax=Novosphingobium rhizosphaerae TaxID=1551649 RepID=UPI0015CD56B1